jgi:hypothetical protein
MTCLLENHPVRDEASQRFEGTDSVSEARGMAGFQPTSSQLDVSIEPGTVALGQMMSLKELEEKVNGESPHIN